MSDPLSITAAGIGIAVPALHATRLLLDDIKRLVDAPETVQGLRKDLLSVEAAYTSLKAIPERDWNSLGADIVTLAKRTIADCDESCSRFHEDLKRWTRHSNGATLSKRDRISIGFFRERQIRAASDQLQITKTTFTAVVGITNLYSTFRAGEVNDETRKTVMSLADQLQAEVLSTRQGLRAVQDRLELLHLKSLGDGEGIDDRAGAIEQLNSQTEALEKARQILEKLMATATEKNIQEAVGSSDQSVTISFQGPNNQGLQVAISHGPITFGGSP